jgi:pyridoxamine 5'-phosphate oxidase
MDPFQSPDDDPLDVFRSWFEGARTTEPNNPDAAALATCTPDGKPSVRIVLVKGVDESGFVFFTNAESRKGAELRANPQAALCFHWKSRQQQVRVEGDVIALPAAAADQYFQTRLRTSQIVAWASQQSRPLASRELLEERAREFEALYPTEVPRPPYWKGFVLLPSSIEFWQERPHRLHDRVVFVRRGSAWEKERLYP